MVVCSSFVAAYNGEVHVNELMLLVLQFRSKIIINNNYILFFAGHN